MRDLAGSLFRSSGVGWSLGVYLPTTLVYRLLGLVRGVILAWVLSAAEFGLFQIALLATNVLIPLCSLGWYDGLTRYVPQYESRGELRRFLRTAVLQAMLAATLLLSIGWLLRAPLGQLIFASQGTAPGPVSAAGIPGDAAPGLDGLDNPAARWSGLTGNALIAVWVAIAYLLLVGTLRGLRTFVAVSVLELASNLALTVLAVLCAWTVSGRAEAMLVCYWLAYGLCALPVAVMLVGTLRSRDAAVAVCNAHGAPESAAPELYRQQASTRAIARQMWSFSAWTALGAIVWQTLQYAPVWYLHRFAGPEVVAVLVGVRLLTQAFHIIGVAIATVVQPTATKLWEEGQRPQAERQLQLALKLTCLVLFASAAVFVLAAPWILRLFPQNYAQGLPIMALAVVAGAVAGELFVLMTHFALLERTHWQLLVWLIGLVGTALLASQTMLPDESSAELLRDAAWAATGGLSFALLAAWLLIRMEGRRLGLAAFLLTLTPYAVLLPNALWLAIGVVTAILLVRTRWLLTGEDKAAVLQRWVEIQTRILGR